MPHLIVATDSDGVSELRAQLRPAHLAYLEQSLALLIAAGAELEDDGVTPVGSYYLVDTDVRAEAEAFIASDPYTSGGVFGTISVTRCRRGFFGFARVAS